MDADKADDLRELVAYDDDTAGGLMTTDYFWIYPHRTVAATIAKIREIAPETEFIYYLYVTDQSEKLLGTLSLRTLLLAAPDATIHSIMDTELVTVRPDASAQDVAATIARYDLLACPVTDERGMMLGIVTVDDAIDAIIPERLDQTVAALHQTRPSVAARKRRPVRPRRCAATGEFWSLSSPCSVRVSSRPRPATTSAASRRTRRPARASATRRCGRSSR